MFPKCWTIPLTPSKYSQSNGVVFIFLILRYLTIYCVSVWVGNVLMFLFCFMWAAHWSKFWLTTLKKQNVERLCVCVSVCCSRNIHHRLPRMDGLWEQHCSLVLEQSLSCCKWTTRICRLCQKVWPSWDQCLRWYICGAYGEASLSWI